MVRKGKEIMILSDKEKMSIDEAFQHEIQHLVGVYVDNLLNKEAGALELFKEGMELIRRAKSSIID
jgi:peptide deformylase